MEKKEVERERLTERERETPREAPRERQREREREREPGRAPLRSTSNALLLNDFPPSVWQTFEQPCSLHVSYSNIETLGSQ